jgi:phospholipid/cholesterol/gamma-HCH transport system ATP-binding protein
MIEIKNIEKSFGDSKVLKGVSTIFETGKTNLIIGQSGSGKTVLLKSLLGIHSPEVGTISFDGRVYSQLTPEEKRELRTEIGMVFQYQHQDNMYRQLFMMVLYILQVLEKIQ